MSEPIPESIPTATSRLSHRPTKRSKPSQAQAAISSQSHSLAVLFANADREISIPESSTTGTNASNLSAPPEMVPNVQGSSAGAGSGEFHVYKASRRREYERLKAMDEEVQQEENEKEWQKRKEDGVKKEEKRMNKNKARREKAKERKAAGKKNGVESGEGVENEDAAPVLRKGLGARKDLNKDKTEAQDVLNNGDAQTQQDEVGLTIHDDED